MRPTAVLARALVRPALVLTSVCSARRWLDPEPTMVVECASCRPFCRLLGGEGAEVVTATLPCNPRVIDAQEKSVLSRAANVYMCDVQYLHSKFV